MNFPSDTSPIVSTSETPIASLIIPVYNRQDYLAETIESILNQTETNFELIIADDGSTDQSPNIAQEYAQKDKRIVYFRHSNRGVAETLNAAVQRAQASYVGWVDSDDLLAANALALTANILKQFSSVGLVYTNHRKIDAMGNALEAKNLNHLPYSKERLLVDFVTFHFRLFRKSLFQALGGLESQYIPAEDYDFCLKLSELTDVYHLPQVLYSYRIHQNNVSRTQRLAQINASCRAVEAALQRRGLSDFYELDVAIETTFSLRKKA